MVIVITIIIIIIIYVMVKIIMKMNVKMTETIKIKQPNKHTSNPTSDRMYSLDSGLFNR